MSEFCDLSLGKRTKSFYFFIGQLQVPLTRITQIPLLHLCSYHPIDFGEEEEGLVVMIMQNKSK